MLIYQKRSRKVLGAPDDEFRGEMEIAWSRILFEISSIKIYLMDWKKCYEKQAVIKGEGNVFNCDAFW